MNVRLIAVGKIREPYIAAALGEFRKRLRPYYTFEEIEVKAAAGSDPTKAVREEAQRILRLIESHDAVWLLERSGTQLDSPQLAAKITQAADGGVPCLTFVIAGTFGAGAQLRERANFLWSLSALTFLHEWARAIVLEQLYRAAKIARNEPYHH
ncbi:MAG: 23S rRNA (pseudouridine(1915)-N(3))-methyltransferase RlmH [Candidatus Eremiobacteraeota bacterium]|nr:23S rRNA (pseudouridine(1915)-N(3))-methyltransferase RlmH [Candidatus Eremiobacteraeota bacterium]